MRKTYRVDYNGRGVESSESLAEASKAFWIMVAHEVKCGRGPESVTLQGGKVLPVEEAIPDTGHWARMVLK